MELENVEACLERMDAIEGFLGFGRNDSLFDRTIVKVRNEQGIVWAWTYVCAGDVVDGSMILDYAALISDVLITKERNVLAERTQNVGGT